MAVLGGREHEEGGSAKVGRVTVRRRAEHEKPRHCRRASGSFGNGGWLVEAGKKAEAAWWTGSGDRGVGSGGESRR